MTLIQFTRNFDDESTDRGFQFVFMCDRCGNGFRTHYQPSATGAVSGVLDAAGGLLGGFLGRAADVSHTVQSAAWEKAHDRAFEKAIEEAVPHFHKCKRCGQWVDDDCWNPGRTLCKNCAPDLQEEFSAAQVEAAVADARETAREVDYVTADTFEETIVAGCPHCGAAVSGGKFCQECGQPLAAKRSCIECGVEMQAAAKFCPECGTKQG